jgi:mono/diheme cytochrome c family protein
MLVGCTLQDEAITPQNLGSQSDSVRGPSAAQLNHGRDVWFKSTFGGEIFFGLIVSSAPFNLPVGLENMVRSPRASRFEDWGAINDPDCTAGAPGDFDTCADPNASGVIGLRKYTNPLPVGPRTLIGVACAACHAGLDPSNPPANPDAPAWENIHPTVGNQFLNIGKIFAFNLSPHDPRYQVFHSWAPGTVDTTAIESDHINNPGIVTQFFNFPDRPYFDLNYRGQPITVHRAGQGGEDDSGCERAALRVYFNLGVCAAQCMLPHLANGPGGTQTEIDIQPGGECEQRCPAFVQARSDVGDLCAFIQTPGPPQLKDAPGGDALIDHGAAGQGYLVFQQNCASCHQSKPGRGNNVWSDDEVHPMAEIGTNSCRARTTNWQAGHIWSQFASDEQKARGPGFYRDMPLLGVWATAPFFHNNQLGTYTGDYTVAGRVAAFEDAMAQLLSPVRAPVVARTDTFICLNPTCSASLPAGTPIAGFANIDPHTGTNQCPDFVENFGHWFGTDLSDSDKYALTEFLKTL